MLCNIREALLEQVQGSLGCDLGVSHIGAPPIAGSYVVEKDNLMHAVLLGSLNPKRSGMFAFACVLFQRDLSCW